MCVIKRKHKNRLENSRNKIPCNCVTVFATTGHNRSGNSRRRCMTFLIFYDDDYSSRKINTAETSLKMGTGSPPSSPGGGRCCSCITCTCKDEGYLLCRCSENQAFRYCFYPSCTTYTGILVVGTESRRLHVLHEVQGGAAEPRPRRRPSLTSPATRPGGAGAYKPPLEPYPLTPVRLLEHDERIGAVGPLRVG